MTTCIARTCRAYGRHLTDCQDEECRGCAPRLAADGLALCGYHRDGIARDAAAAAEVYEALALSLAGGSGTGEKVTRSGDGSPAINPAAADARTLIRSTLVSWCRMIAEERGVHLPTRATVEELPPGFIGPPRLQRVPDDRIGAIGAYVARRADWLAAHPAADDAVDELHELAHGQPYRVAYPGGARKFPVRTPDGDYAGCPEEGCEGTLWTILRRESSLLPSEILCTAEEPHRWPTSRWMRLGARLLGRAA